MGKGIKKISKIAGFFWGLASERLIELPKLTSFRCREKVYF